VGGDDVDLDVKGFDEDGVRRIVGWLSSVDNNLPWSRDDFLTLPRSDSFRIGASFTNSLALLSSPSPRKAAVRNVEKAEENEGGGEAEEKEEREEGEGATTEAESLKPLRVRITFTVDTMSSISRSDAIAIVGGGGSKGEAEGEEREEMHDAVGRREWVTRSVESRGNLKGSLFLLSLPSLSCI